MSGKTDWLATKYRAFYEVLPYVVVFQEQPGTAQATTRRVQAGFDVDLYAVKPEDHGPILPPDDEYAPVYAEIRRTVAKVARDTDANCSVEVLPFPSSAVLGIRSDARFAARLRIRISRSGHSHQAAGSPELRALEQVEEQLKALGVLHR